MNTVLPATTGLVSSFDFGSSNVPRECTRLMQARRGPGMPLDWYAIVPAVARRRGAFISVHGVSRNALEHAALWAPLAERVGMPVIAPRFSRKDFPGYQRLERTPGKAPADDALLSLITFLRSNKVITEGPLVFFGYSGGAQFVHRFMLAHPPVVDAAIITAAGWYTFPDPALPFPRGIGPSENCSFPLDSRGWFRKPLLVAVGEDDVEQDKQFRRDEELDRLQGRSRLERACRWTYAIRDEAARQGLDARLSLVSLRGAAHSFRACVKAGLNRVVEHFITKHVLTRDGQS